MSPIEGARPSAGSSIASAWLYPPALHTPQVPTLGRFVLLPPGPRLTPLPPVDDVAWLRGVGVCVCGGVSPVLNATHTWGLRGCCRALSPVECASHSHAWRGLSPARLSPYGTALGKGALVPSTQAPLPLRLTPTPEERPGGSGRRDPNSLLKALPDLASLVASSS